jgi:transposase, IS5 family
MYRKLDSNLVQQESIEFPVEYKLAEDNRWVILSNLIPWEEFEEEYADQFSTDTGAPAKSFRMALGALIIKERLGVSDRETVEQIRENPYLQYFLGISVYSNQQLFDASMLVHFRQRISGEMVNRINRKLFSKPGKKAGGEGQEKKLEGEKREPPNQGKLILDATCAPADIAYPTDLNLLNLAREQTERIIDILHDTAREKIKKKPRTHRRIARKDYLKVSKKRRPTKKQRQKAIKKQLQYVKRNLAHIGELEKVSGFQRLSRQQYKTLLVVAEVYRQQLWMSENNKQRVDDRIVSIMQPHIRPIVRGKAGKSVEFGAKLSVSCVDGYVFLDRIDWNNFNESCDLESQIETFKNYTGLYPESVHVDKIYRNRKNRAFCKEKGIRISGISLGRPKNNVSKEEKKQAQNDERVRNCIEGKFGEGKRRYSLNLVMAKLPNSSETVIAITFLTMNLFALLRQILLLFLQKEYRSYFSLLDISKNYIRCQLVTQNLFDSLPSLSIDLLKYRLFTFSASPN